MRLPAIVVVVGAFIGGATACGGGSGGSPTNGGGNPGPVQHPSALVGVVGQHDAFSISLQDQAGNPITNLAAGTYQLTVHDDSSLHDFHLTGAGVDDATQIGEKTTKTFTVTFKPGTYTFLCDPHASQMHGSFKVS